MTTHDDPLDLDAIRALVARINEGVDAGEVSLSPDSPARYSVMLVRLIDRDVPALLARIAELEAERDLLEASADEIMKQRDMLSEENIQLWTRVEQAEARATALPAMLRLIHCTLR